MKEHSNHQRLRLACERLGASAGPLSLLLLPKCPLCLLPLLALLGIPLRPSIGLWIAAGVVVGAWLAILLVAARRHPLVGAGALMAAAVSLVAVGMHSRMLLMLGVMAMVAVGLGLSRRCVHRAARLQEP